MKYKDLIEFDSETQKLIKDFMEEAGVLGFEKVEDFMKIIIILAEKYSSKAMSVDDFSFFSDKLFLILQKHDKSFREQSIGVDNIMLEEFLEWCGDADWYVNQRSREGFDKIETIIDITKNLKDIYTKVI